MAGFRIEGATSGNVAEVDASNNLRVRLPGSSSPTLVGAALNFSENDPGTKTGTPNISSPETDGDYRLRISPELPLDIEIFNYAAQNTGKHTYANTTMTITWGVGALTTNASSITTLNTGVSFGTYALFPLIGSSSLYCEFEGSFTQQPTTNTTLDVGMFLRGASTAYAPTDGVYFRLTSAGIVGILNYNGAETPSGSVFDFTYTNNQKYKFLITITTRKVQFWIDDVLYAQVETQAGNGQPFASASLPFSLRHSILAAAGAVFSFQLADYSISSGGSLFSRSLGEFGNASYGSYQGLSGGTMGTLGNYANSANPTALVPTNTTIAAGSVGLGGQTWETDSVALTTDCIIMSYLNPAATVSVQGRRLKISGVTIDSYVQTVLATPAYVAQWSLAFGHTGGGAPGSLATAEAATTKAPRRVALGIQPITTLVVNTVFPRVQQTFANPIYVNPGEYVQVVKKKVGTTTTTTGVIAHIITFDYAWE
jgi:hypothetical protein